MKNQIKHILFKILLKCGLWVGQVPKRKALQNLLLNLKPIQTEHKLIRIGANFDGGYLVPDDLEGVNCCLSPGVGTSTTFENDLLKRGVPSYLLDFSVQELSQPFNFRKNYLGSFDHGEFISLATWLKDVSETPDYLLQMDIEGFEYEVLESISDTDLLKFRVMVIEFHSISNVLNPSFFERFRKVLDRLLEHFYIVHTHLNNNDNVAKYHGEFIPRTAEVTFLRKDRAFKTQNNLSLPHPLDFSNNPNKPNYPIPKIWRRTFKSKN